MLIGTLSVALAGTLSTGATADTADPCVSGTGACTILTCGDDLATAIGAAASGDTLVLDCATAFDLDFTVVYGDLTITDGAIRSVSPWFTLSVGGRLVLRDVDFDLNGAEGILQNPSTARTTISGGTLHSGGGSALHVSGGTVVVDGAVIEDAGAIYQNNNSTLRFIDSTIVDTPMENDALFAALHLDGSTVRGTSGSLLSIGGEASLTDTELDGQGQAQLVYFHGRNLTLCGGEWHGGSAGSVGGAGHLDGPVETPGGCATLLVRDNVTRGHGGGLYLTRDTTLRNLHVSGNEADIGGGIYSAGELTCVGCILDGNTSDVGAGIAAIDDLALHDTVLSNHTSQQGTVALLGGAELTATDAEWSNNTATLGGAAVWVEDGAGPVALERSKLCFNDAGAGAAVDGDPAGPFDLTLTRTLALANVGVTGANLVGRGQTLLMAVDLLSSTAEQGPAAYQPAGSIDLQQVYAVANEATVASSAAVDGVATGGGNVGVANLPTDATTPGLFAAGSVVPLAPICDFGSLYPREAGVGALAEAVGYRDGDGDGLDWTVDCDDDDADEGGPRPIWVDADGDGFAGTLLEACPHEGTSEEPVECSELLDGFEGGYWYADEDGDGLGGENLGLRCDGDVPDDPSWVTDGGDCDDDDAALGLPEQGYVDEDGDGYGAGDRVEACPGDGHSANDADCDDEDAGIHPGAADRCDGVDDNCSGDESDCLGDSADTADTGGPDGTATNGTNGTAPSSTDSDDADGTTDGAEADEKGGCGCQSAPAGSSAACLLGLLVLVARRR